MDINERVTKIEKILQDVILKISENSDEEDWAFLARTLSPINYQIKYCKAFGFRHPQIDEYGVCRDC